MSSNIPKHWVETTLGSIATHPQYGWTTKATNKGKYKYFRTTDIKDPVDWNNVPFCSELPKNPEDFVIHKNDILVSRAGSVGLSIRIKEDLPDTLFASYLIRFTPIAPINSKIIEYFFNTKEYWSFISDSQAGIAVPNVNASKLSDLPFPLPPLNEQKRIVAKLDAILPKVKNAKARLENISKILKKFRQSVLSDACSGKLTEEWREGKQLPEWEEKKIEDIGTLGRGRSKHRPRNDPKLFSGKYPFIQTGDIAQSKEYIVAHSQTLNEVGLAQSRMWPKNTLCITIAANIANTAILSYPACFPDSVVGFINDENESELKFVKWVIDNIKNDLENYAPATAQKNINLGILNKVVFKCPPIEEQHEIVRRVEKLFEVADSIEEKYKAALTHVEKIEQSVLAKAFRGELVEPDPNDEPAEILLKRILDLKAKSVPPKKRKKKKEK
ncbi:MAG: restriction endonuclease subunit S [bacterium]